MITRLDEFKAQKAIDFISMLRHTGDFFGKPFNPMEWQKDVLKNVYGTVDAETGFRRYKYAYLEIPKKNGKTELIAGLSVYHLICDPAGGQIYCCAADRHQASLVFNAARDMIGQSVILDKMVKIKESIKEIHNLKTGTVMKVLSAEAYSKHGLNPSVIIFDELHALQKRDLWDVMTYGSGAAREEQLVWVITTAGDDPDRKSIGWEKHEYAQKIISGEIVDETWFARIYSAPQDADIFDEETWFKANPSLGVTLSLKNVREEAQQARNSASAEKLFRWLRLNQWVALKRVGWLPLTLWDETEANWTAPDLAGQECYLGVDLSATTDITAVAAVFPPKNGEKWRFFIESFIPEDNMPERENRDHVPFNEWVKGGYVHATPGNCVDYAYVAKRIETLVRKYKVKHIAADAWRIESLAQLMDNRITKDKIITIPQTISGMSPAMKELERMMFAGEIEHEKNPCGRWAFGNVIIAQDGNGNIKPHKGRSIDRIDPIVAVINAMAAAIKLENKRNVYEDRGIRSL